MKPFMIRKQLVQLLRIGSENNIAQIRRLIEKVIEPLPEHLAFERRVPIECATTGSLQIKRESVRRPIV